ncbi:MAG: GNAT family N-acetyltransferase [Dehalococcoidia bacterium]|nr:MAG: GNAT family N-acetyltransferase [Dehalococcoidia bacterium]
MASEINNLVRLNKAQVKPAAEVLSRAFQNYPLLRYYFPDELKRRKMASFFVSVPVYYGLRYGEVYATSTGLEGIAVWLPSENCPMAVWKILRSVPMSVLFGFGRYGGSKMRRMDAYIDEIHKRLVPYPHWFLQAVGVDPRYKGQGYASRLLKPMLARIDEEGLPCYLETHNESNVSLYEHFDFAVIEKSTIPETNLTNWAMLRKND